ncbi:hypothetical protein TNCV_3851381 [Trichonephila clavipes]|nr:hypothetical protein TNCV_3851381 [Trichonephila clavipes]
MIQRMEEERSSPMIKDGRKRQVRWGTSSVGALCTVVLTCVLRVDLHASLATNELDMVTFKHWRRLSVRSKGAASYRISPRERGRPRTKWMEKVEKGNLGVNQWKNIASNRSRWRKPRQHWLVTGCSAWKEEK